MFTICSYFVKQENSTTYVDRRLPTRSTQTERRRLRKGAARSRASNRFGDLRSGADRVADAFLGEAVLGRAVELLLRGLCAQATDAVRDKAAASTMRFL